jgi:hypothetical protein
MSADKNKIDSSAPDASSSGHTIIGESQANNQSRTTRYDRKLLLLTLLMILVISQVVVLLANSGLIQQSPEPVSSNEQTITQDGIKAVNADLKGVIKSLNTINKNPDLRKDHVEVKKVETKPVEVLAAPEVLKKNIKPKQKITENNKAVTVKKSQTVVLSEPVSINKDLTPTIEEPVAEIKAAAIKPVYIKYDAKGSSLADNDQQWACVYDTQNGLMWEVKSRDDSLRNADNLYSWFDPEHAAVKGKADGGRCKGDINCDTSAYVHAMNQQNYCGHNDWRLPTREQMQTLVNLENTTDNVKINKQYFPQTVPSWYWTSSENKDRDDYAWYVLFRNGFALNDLKERPKHVRLVRSMQENTASDSHVY